MKLSRRNFLRVTAAAAASAGLAGCGSKNSTAAGSAMTAPFAQANSEASAEPTPTPEPVYEADLLTGEARDASAPKTHIVGVMINNISNTSYQNARPQRGLSSAKILVEIKVEGGITRFCALFDNTGEIPEIGPIRSGRDQFLQLLMPWRGLYYHDGESIFCTRFICDWEYWDLNIGGKSWFDTPTHTLVSHRDKRGRNVASEHTEFTSGEEIDSAIEKAGIDMSYEYNGTFFTFTDYRKDNYNLMEDGEEALNITLRHSSSYRTYFQYDADSKTYKMSQYSAASREVTDTCDELNGEQLAFTNLVVIFTQIAAYPGDSHDVQNADYYSGGDGWVFTNGRMKQLNWKKARPCDPLTLSVYGDEGAKIVLNRGKTYLAVVDLDEAGGCSYSGSETAASDDLSDAGTPASVVDDADATENSEDAAAGISTQ